MRIGRVFRKFWMMVCGTALFLLMASPAQGADVTAKVNPQVEVAGDQVRFGDLAEIAGPDSEQKSELGKVFLGAAPRLGQKTIWRRAFIETRLKAAKISLDQVDLELPDSVTISRAGQKIDNDWVRNLLEEYLSSKEPYKSSSWNLISFRAASLPAVPNGQLTYHATAQNSSNPSRLTLNIIVLVDGQEAAKMRAMAEVEMSVPAVVATRRMEKGDRISPDDVKLAEVNQNLVHSGALTDVKQAVGQACRTRLQPGQPILAKDLTKAEVIGKGDRVTIVAQSGALKVTAVGQAKQSGAMGENIQILNTASNKTIMAKVVGVGIVEVIF